MNDLSRILRHSKSQLFIYPRSIVHTLSSVEPSKSQHLFRLRKPVLARSQHHHPPATGGSSLRPPPSTSASCVLSTTVDLLRVCENRLRKSIWSRRIVTVRVPALIGSTKFHFTSVTNPEVHQSTRGHVRPQGKCPSSLLDKFAPGTCRLATWCADGGDVVDAWTCGLLGCSRGYLRRKDGILWLIMVCHYGVGKKIQMRSNVLGL